MNLVNYQAEDAVLGSILLKGTLFGNLTVTEEQFTAEEQAYSPGDAVVSSQQAAID